MTIKQIKNVPILKYGLADNGYLFIPEEICTEDKFVDVVIVDVIDEFVRYWYDIPEGNIVVGKIDSIVRHWDGYVYGNITLYYNNFKPLRFKNYCIKIIDSETNDDGVVVIKDFSLESISLNFNFTESLE